MDDGNQSTADLHAREDLLLDHYSQRRPDSTGIRIPINRAMELIVAKGLPVAAPSTGDTKLALRHDARTKVTAAVDHSGFARTGYELDTMEARRAEAGLWQRGEQRTRRVRDPVK